MKIISMEWFFLSIIAENTFLDIKKFYDKRSEIYAMFIRGEITAEIMADRETKNEKTKNELFKRYLKEWQATGEAPDDRSIAKLNAVGNGIGKTIISYSKYIVWVGIPLSKK